MNPVYISIEQVRTGENLKAMLKKSGLKVKDVQEACGFEQPQAVYKWLNGQSLPSLDNLLILSRILKTSMESILVTSEDALPRYGGLGHAGCMRELQIPLFLQYPEDPISAIMFEKSMIQNAVISYSCSAGST